MDEIDDEIDDDDDDDNKKINDDGSWYQDGVLYLPSSFFLPVTGVLV